MKIYNVNGTQEAISPEKIVIYGRGRILYEIEQSNFEVKEISKNEKGEAILRSTYAAAPEAIYLNQPVKKARKENLNRTDNYTLNFSLSYMKNWIRTALYIHESEIAVEDLGDILASETSEERNYLHAVKLDFHNPAVFKRLHFEKIPCDGNWKIPDGGRWSSSYGTVERPCYDPYDNSKSPFSAARAAKYPDYNPEEKGVIKRWTTEETEENASLICTFRYYTKTEYSPERIRKNKLAEALNNSGCFKERFSHYDIEKLEKVFNITLKTEETA